MAPARRSGIRGPDGCSPCVRGWTRPVLLRRHHGHLLPAHVGMNPRTASRTWTPRSAPRACGDGPPPTRIRTGRCGLLPAYAGMNPARDPAATHRCPAPCACRDGPETKKPAWPLLNCSPRMRGWTPPRPVLCLVEPLLCACGDVPPGAVGPRSERRLLPAYAGMNPAIWSGPRLRTSASCMRGWSRGRRRLDRPAHLLPVRAGMTPRRRRTRATWRSAPRVRGDAPGPQGHRRGFHNCSPRTRGWSSPPGGRHRRLCLLPGACGDAPASTLTSTMRVAVPYVCGDGPNIPPAMRICSPVPCTRGEDPRGVRRGWPMAAVPRACGDVPALDMTNGPDAVCSPHAWGWSRAR